MIDFNKVILIGQVTKGPELKQDRHGNWVCSGEIVNRRRWVTADKREHSEEVVLPFVAWNALAEIFAKRVQSGDCVLLEGKLKKEHWMEDGNLRSEVVITATAYQCFPDAYSQN
jgi:single-strand DNA-binding protein